MTRVGMTLDTLNAASEADFATALGQIFEGAQWVAEAAAGSRPFPTVEALHQAMFDVVERASADTIRHFLSGHPDLAGQAAQARAMAAFSIAEQDGLRLATLDAPRFDAMQRMNAAYRQRFGIPFILCVRRHTRDSMLDVFARRLAASPEDEHQAALREVFLITRLRIADTVSGPGMPATTGALSTHVLSTALGRPAEGVHVTLFEIDAGALVQLVDCRTNHDGRTDAPLIAGVPLRTGRYELRFRVADHFRRSGLAVTDPPFYDEIPVRFAIAEPETHYHIPLLISPGTYTTYRGS